MRIDEHLNAFQEHRDAIDWAINRGIENSQRIIDTHASRGINKIDVGFQINHRWFKSEKVSEKFPDFPKKRMIIVKMAELENMSENLTYGSKKSEKEIKEVVELMNSLETMLKGLMSNEG